METAPSWWRTAPRPQDGSAKPTSTGNHVGEHRWGSSDGPHQDSAPSRQPFLWRGHQGILPMVPGPGEQRCRHYLAWFWSFWQWTNPNYPQHLPLSASTAFSNITVAQRNQLVVDLVAAETSREGAVTGSTHENQAWSLHRFSKYLHSIGIGQDVFLDSFTGS